VAVAHAGNDHRLGANEAPPAIVSIFLGDMLQDIVEQIEQGGARSAKAGGELKIGVSVLPTLPRDPGDRNRTSPFAFTGNKFEFRAVGSAQSIAGPIVVLNTIVAESLDEIATQLEQAVAAKRDLNTEIQKVLQPIVKESKSVLFNGDNYSEAWHAEAERRGLTNRRTTVDSLPDLISPKAIGLFGKYHVLNERELHSRYEIFLENYRKTINIESQLTIQIAQRMILPAALRYQEQVASAISSLKATGVTVPKTQVAHLSELVAGIEALQSATDHLSETIEEPAKGDSLDHAKHARDQVVPAMNAVRSAGDHLETLVADDLWPLPTYQEMLFIK
jgi:glutamine synthetase